MREEIANTGSPHAPLWIISCRPHYKDIGSIFSRQHVSGREFYMMLDAARPRHPIHVRSVHPYAVPKKEEGKYKAQLPAALPDLQAAIQEYKPKIVVLLGEALTLIEPDKENIHRWRGHLFWSETLGCKCLATYTPNAVTQNWYTGQLAPGTLRALFIHDIAKADAQAASHTLEHYQYTTIAPPSIEQIEDWTERCLAEATILSYDIETLYPYSASFIDCIGFAYKLDEAICIPLYSPHSATPRYTPQNMVRAMRCIHRLLTSAIPKVAQNSQFDTLTLLHHYGIHTQNVVWDTMIAASNIEADFPRDLGFLISIYTNLPQHKPLIHSRREQDRWEYNGADCIANLHVMAGQKAAMRERGILHHFRTITMPTLEPLVYMQHAGVALDEHYRDLSLLTEGLFQRGAETIISATVPWPYNPSSHTQSKALFFGACAETVVRKNGKPTTDKAALEKIAKRTVYTGVAQLARLHILLAESKATLTAMGTAGARIHTKYGLGGQDIEGEHNLGTDTGRLNSRKPDIWILTPEGPVQAGRNLQNLKGPQRKQLIPDPGYEFICADLYSAEAILVALEGQETALLSMMARGEKIHDFLLAYARERWPAECEEFRYDYSQAKRTVHTFNYAGTPAIVRQQQKLPHAMATDLYEFYHTSFPGVKRRQELIERSIKQNREIRTLLGRCRRYHAPEMHKIIKAAYATPSQSVIGEHTNRAVHRLYYAWRAGLCPLIPCMNTHDGVIAQSPLDQRAEATRWITWAFAVPIQCGDLSTYIPLEVAFGRDFYEATHKSTPKEVYTYE